MEKRSVRTYDQYIKLRLLLTVLFILQFESICYDIDVAVEMKNGRRFETSRN